MAFVEMNRGDGIFVAWGEDKAKPNSYVVKKGESITGMVTRMKNSDSYGKILELKTKDHDEPLIILGTTILMDSLGYVKKDKSKMTWADNMMEKPNVVPVKENDVVRITFKGMLPTKHGKAAYDFKIEVDR
jgi:tRNA A37 threonylcarbamoyladenosine synthetase subunit TsaC/SUA5/YrdC